MLMILLMRWNRYPRSILVELGKVNDFTEEELKQLYTTIGLGALEIFPVTC